MHPGIQAEIKQTKPFGSLEEEAFLALQRTADQLNWRVAEMLKPYGLSPTQYNALRILRGAGPDGIPCSDIAERMITRDPDITRLLDRLQKRGLVERSRGKQDRRVIYGKITAAGLNLLREMDSPLRKFGREILRHVSQANLKLLIDLLEQVRGGAGTPFDSLRAGSARQTS